MPPPSEPEWQVDGEEFLLNPVFEPEPPSVPVLAPVRAEPVRREQAPAVALAPPIPSDEPPPSVERIVEAMLFVGGPPLTPAHAAAAVRGLSADEFHAAALALGKRYRAQNRPYAVRPQSGGYVLALRPSFEPLREKLFGGPKEARLSQPVLDVLSLVAYRQPIAKGDIDALRGADAAGALRQLVRLGLVSVSRRTEGGERVVTYGTTKRFLELFQIESLDDLPRLGDAQALA
jgi:segregation and condensation protein B